MGFHGREALLVSNKNMKQNFRCAPFPPLIPRPPDYQLPYPTIHFKEIFQSPEEIVIDREAREIILLVRLSALSRLNRLTFDLDFRHEGRP